MLVHVHRTCAAGVGITAGGIVPHCSCARCKPNVESVEEHAVGIVRVDRDSLVVPVLRIVAGGILAVSERAALRAFHVSPAGAAICGSPGAKLATSCAATTAIAIPNDGLRLRVDVIRVTRRDCDVDASELVVLLPQVPSLFNRIVAGVPLPAFMGAPVGYGLPAT